MRQMLERALAGFIAHEQQRHVHEMEISKLTASKAPQPMSRVKDEHFQMRTGSSPDEVQLFGSV
jgi:hypothetical protein